MMKTMASKELTLNGQTGTLTRHIIQNWLLDLRQTNPAILDMFRDRDVLPYRDLLPWSGEFAGKYLTSCYYCYQLTHSETLYAYVCNFIDEMITYQDSNGYLGCFSKACHLTGAFSVSPDTTGNTWDAWNHYHTMYGLLMWYDLTGNPLYFQAIEKIAGLFMHKFYNSGITLASIGWCEMNLAVYHIFGILYRRTKNPAYLDFAKHVEEDLSAPNAGDYINYAKKGYEYYQCPKPRWESMHAIMGIAEMYRNTGDTSYLDAVKQIFYSILKTDVHNTGAFSTDEQAIGTPYKNANIETCCVVAYNALAIEVYLLTGDLAILDFLERSHYNAVLGYFSPSGRWSTYHTPMDGVKCANYHSIGFQCRPGSPELNCCSVNAPRGVASVFDWMVTENDGTVYINFYEAMHAVMKNGMTIDITGDYPAENIVRIRITSAASGQRTALRIPKWSNHTTAVINGTAYTPEAGTYFSIAVEADTEIELTFDFSPYTEAGGGDYSGMQSIYVGPILFGLDNSCNPHINFTAPPKICAEKLYQAVPHRQKDGSITLNIEEMILTDFYHLGVRGSSYKTWLTVAY